MYNIFFITLCYIMLITTQQQQQQEQEIKKNKMNENYTGSSSRPVWYLLAAASTPSCITRLKCHNCAHTSEHDSK